MYNILSSWIYLNLKFMILLQSNNFLGKTNICKRSSSRTMEKSDLLYIF